jgi:hypothetical protein
MAIRKIAHIGHPVLRQVARPVTREELATPALQAFIDDLIETMRDADGAGPRGDPGLRADDDLRDRGARQPALPVQARDPADRAGQPGPDASPTPDASTTTRAA